MLYNTSITSSVRTAISEVENGCYVGNGHMGNGGVGNGEVGNGDMGNGDMGNGDVGRQLVFVLLFVYFISLSYKNTF